MADKPHVAALLRAIEGFSGAESRNRAHSDSIGLLSKIKGDIERGRSSNEENMSPGRQEVIRATQKEMPAERGEGGIHAEGGHTKSNLPGSAERHGPVPDVFGGQPPRLSGAYGGSDTRGNVISMKPSPFPHQVSELRRLAAERESSRPDTRMGDGKRSENERAMMPGRGEATETGRLGAVRAPKLPAEGRGGIRDSAHVEPHPGEGAGQEDLNRTEGTRASFAEANERARKMLRGMKGKVPSRVNT